MKMTKHKSSKILILIVVATIMFSLSPYNVFSQIFPLCTSISGGCQQQTDLHITGCGGSIVTPTNPITGGGSGGTQTFNTYSCGAAPNIIYCKLLKSTCLDSQFCVQSTPTVATCIDACTGISIPSGDSRSECNDLVTTGHKCVLQAKSNGVPCKSGNGICISGACYTECTPGTTRPCPLREGLCSNSYQTCLSTKLWSSCTDADYGPCLNILFYKNKDGSTFRSCNLPETNRLKLKSFLSSSSAPSNVEQDIKNEGLCTNLGSWYCNYDSSWKYALQYGINYPVNAKKDTVELSKDSKYSEYYTSPKIASTDGCCPSSFCFNGTGCENSRDYTIDAKKPPIFKAEPFGQTGYRCSQTGEWKEVSLRKDYFFNDTGYCTEDTECYAKNKCYPDGNWSIFGIDRLCYKGTWTTRSKYIAAALLTYTQRSYVSPHDYTLYCDSLETALGEAASDISYTVKITQSNKEVKFSDFTPQMSGMCILKYDNKIIIGTALYKPIDVNYPVYEAFGFEENECDPLFEDEFDISSDSVIRICNSAESGALFYSPKKQVMFYSADSSVPNFDTTPMQDFINVLTSPLTVIVNFVKGLISDTPQDVEMVDKIADFNKVFFLQRTTKSLNGIVETKIETKEGITTGKTMTALSLNYTGFSSDTLCSAIQASLTNSICEKRGSSVTVFESNEDEEAFNNVWPDLTAKLRVS